MSVGVTTKVPQTRVCGTFCVNLHRRRIRQGKLNPAEPLKNTLAPRGEPIVLRTLEILGTESGVGSVAPFADFHFGGTGTAKGRRSHHTKRTGLRVRV